MKPEELAELRHYARTIMGDHTYRISSCDGKSAFRSFDLADRTIRRECRREMAAYHCGACGQFHVGSREHRDRRRRAKKMLRQRYERA